MPRADSTLSPDAGERIRDALGLAAAGIRMMRLNLERRHPEASPDEIERLLTEWLLDGPPDSPGHPRRLRHA
ncbi:MAG: hypothetical protein ACRD07_09960 [Acidimicrobiales bacterium]